MVSNNKYKYQQPWALDYQQSRKMFLDSFGT